MKVAYRDDLAVINVSNPYGGRLRLSGGGEWPLTTKGNDDAHGFGMKSIEQVAQKYGGAATYEADGEYFTLNMVIPLATGEDA